MTRAWYIAWKDLRLQRWTLAAWLFMLLVSVSYRLSVPLVRDDPGWRMAVPLWILILGFGYVPIWIAVIANTIQSDRLVGSTAFWLTRPIPPGTLLGGKLLGLVTVVVLPSLLLDAILMAAFHVSPGVILAALLQKAWMLAILTLIIVFLSAITATVVRVLIVLAVACTAELVWIQITVALLRRRLTAAGAPPAFMGVSLPFGYMDPNAMVLGGTVFAIGVSIAIAYQYRYRRRGPTIALFVAVMAATWLLQGAWDSVPLIREPSVEHEPWARGAQARLRTVDVVSGRPLPAEAGILRFGDRTAIAAPVMLDGLPPGYVATPIMQHAEVTFDDHTRTDAPGLPDADREITLGTRVERWATLLDLDNETLRRHGTRAATYTGTFDFVIEQRTPIATLPAAVGATASDGVRSVTVSATRFETSGCTLRLRTTAVRLATHALERPDLVLRYRFRDGREMVDPYTPARHLERSFLQRTYAASTVSLLNAFAVNVHSAYPMLRDDARNHPAEAIHAACSDISIEVASIRYAGRLTRTLELRDFHLTDPSSTR